FEVLVFFFFFSSRRRHTRFSRDWSSDVCSSDLVPHLPRPALLPAPARGAGAAVTTTTVRWSAADLAQAVGTPPPTPQQAAVIEAPPEAHLVVAGAGSGKTETMAARVVWLVANGLVDPAEVLGLTFTRKAAMELGDRIGRRLRTLREAGIWHAEETDPLALP